MNILKRLSGREASQLQDAGDVGKATGNGSFVKYNPLTHELLSGPQGPFGKHKVVGKVVGQANGLTQVQVDSGPVLDIVGDQVVQIHAGEGAASPRGYNTTPQSPWKPR